MTEPDRGEIGALLDQVRQGDRAGFSELYDAIAPAIYAQIGDEAVGEARDEKLVTFFIRLWEFPPAAGDATDRSLSALEGTEGAAGDLPAELKTRILRRIFTQEMIGPRTKTFRARNMLFLLAVIVVIMLFFPGDRTGRDGLSGDLRTRGGDVLVELEADQARAEIAVRTGSDLLGAVELVLYATADGDRQVLTTLEAGQSITLAWPDGLAWPAPAHVFALEAPGASAPIATGTLVGR